MFSSNFLEVHLLLGTNRFQPFSDEKFVSEFSKQPVEESTDRYDENEDRESDEQISHSSRNEAKEAMET